MAAIPVRAATGAVHVGEVVLDWDNRREIVCWVRPLVWSSRNARPRGVRVLYVVTQRIAAVATPMIAAVTKRRRRVRTNRLTRPVIRHDKPVCHGSGDSTLPWASVRE